jgi:hypothetical protein
MRRTMTAFVVSLAGAAACALSSEPPLLWIEGESAARSETHRNAWFDAVDPLELSGGAQIANFSETTQSSGWAAYDVSVPAAGAYHFWLRANPCTGMRYQIDGGSWSALDPAAMEQEDRKNRDKAGYVQKVRQWFNVAADGTHDARTMTWYYRDAIDLTRGTHQFRFSLGGEEAGTKRFAAIDCFVLTPGSFEPNFQYKPGEKPADTVSFAEGETWAFSPAPDTFSPDARLDLRGLNEEYAGEHGFIRISGDGNDFVRGDGQPIRFWGGSTYVQRTARERKDQAVLEHHARFLAKRGVNIVRLHGAIQPKNERARLTDVDENELDEIYRLVAAMKKAGVYTIISPYWAVQVHAPKDWGVADAENGNCTAELFFDPVLQKGYKAWLKRIYADTNPHTGIPLAKDPAVAIIQIQNEDSMLFWTMQSVKGKALLNLRALYGDWVRAKYRSFEKAMEAWQGYRHEEDDFANARPGMFIVWELTQAARNKKGNAPGREARLADQAEFMGRMMYDFNTEIARYLREELGCTQLINAGNWRSADQVILDDVERCSYTACEVVAKNHYFGGIHNGLNVGWQILPGQVFTSKSFTREPFGSPLNIRQAVGHPFIVPESLWVPPMRYEAEGPLIVAAQSCLTGLDTFYWFATGEEEWQRPMNKWTFSIPMTLGQFPAAALIFRKGYVRQGPAVVHEERALADVWARALPLIAEEGAWDPNRDKGQMPAGTPFKTSVDPRAYLVGRVEVVYGGDPAKSTVADLSRYIDSQKRVVRSVTSEITTDLAAGVYRVDTPTAQAAAGFLGAAGPQKLSDVAIECKNEYAAIAIVPLDDKTIATSGKLLVQIGTLSRPTGWKERPLKIPQEHGSLDGARIIEVGTDPWQIEKTRATIVIRNASLATATALDPNGMRVAEVPLEKASGAIKIVLPPDAMYLCLQSAR